MTNRYHIHTQLGRSIEQAQGLGHLICDWFSQRPGVYWGRHPATVVGPAVIVFPCLPNRLSCGLAGIIAVKGSTDQPSLPDLSALSALVDAADGTGLEGLSKQTAAIDDGYLGGRQAQETLQAEIRSLKQEAAFLALFKDPTAQQTISEISAKLAAVRDREESLLSNLMGSLETRAVDIIAQRIEALKDMTWCLDAELAGNIKRIRRLIPEAPDSGPDDRITLFRQINAVLNSIDRLEVRGRDSAGISILFIMPDNAYQDLADELDRSDLGAEFRQRMNGDVLGNASISLNQSTDDDGKATAALTVVYKIAAEIGSLGDNIRFLRRQLQQDRILQ